MNETRRQYGFAPLPLTPEAGRQPSVDRVVTPVRVEHAVPDDRLGPVAPPLPAAFGATPGMVPSLLSGLSDEDRTAENSPLPAPLADPSAASIAVASESQGAAAMPASQPQCKFFIHLVLPHAYIPRSSTRCPLRLRVGYSFQGTGPQRSQDGQACERRPDQEGLHPDHPYDTARRVHPRLFEGAPPSQLIRAFSDIRPPL